MKKELYYLVKEHYIYILKDPNYDAVQYVGLTSDNLERRLSGHISTDTLGIKKYKRKPIMEVIMIFNANRFEAELQEHYWIEILKPPRNRSVGNQYKHENTIKKLLLEIDIKNHTIDMLKIENSLLNYEYEKNWNALKNE